MTIDVPTAVVVGGAISALAGVGAWVANTTVFRRLDALEEKHAANAREFREANHALDKRLLLLEPR
jgi:hypothetical protein